MGVSGVELAVFVTTFVVGTIATLFLTFWTVRHGYWMYLDLYTEDRKSVSHRRQVPEITFVYKCVNWCTLLSMVCACINNWGFIVGWLSPDLTACRIAQLVGTQGFVSKIFIYFVYLFRLHLVYSGSQYAKSPTVLKVIATVITVIILYITVLFGYYSFAATDDSADKDSADDVMTYTEDGVISDDWYWTVQFGEYTDFYKVCIATPSDVDLTIYGLTDIISNLGFTISFIRPIRDVIRKVQGSRRDVTDKSKMSRKMLFVGFKVALLSAVQFFSTIIALVVYGAGVNLFLVDLLINGLCLSLMTAYYPDSKYYQKLCKCCIACCDRKGYTTGKMDDLVPAVSPRNNEPTVTDMVGDPSSLDNKSGTGPSADTMSAVRIGAKEENPLKSDTNDTEMELATHLNK